MKIKMLYTRDYEGNIIWNKDDIFEICEKNDDYYIVKIEDGMKYGIEKKAINEYEMIEDED